MVLSVWSNFLKSIYGSYVQAIKLNNRMCRQFLLHHFYLIVIIDLQPFHVTIFITITSKIVLTITNMFKFNIRITVVIVFSSRYKYHLQRQLIQRMSKPLHIYFGNGFFIKGNINHTLQKIILSCSVSYMHIFQFQLQLSTISSLLQNQMAVSAFNHHRNSLHRLMFNEITPTRKLMIRKAKKLRKL